jgi:FkbM family methyltransferase
MIPSDEEKDRLLQSCSEVIRNFFSLAVGEKIRPCDALFAYRLLLGRMPSTQAEITYISTFAGTYREFIGGLLDSDEFGKRLRFLPGGRQLMTEANGFRFWFNSSDREMGGSMAGGSYEPDTVSLVRRLVKPGATCLDIGAQTGFFTCLLGQLVGPSGRVLAFEPLQGSFELLKKNVLENGIQGRTVIRQVACAEKPGKLQVEIKSRMIVAARNGTLSIDAVAIDDEVGGHVDFCKIDVEGHEPSVIRGMTRIVTKQRPIILTEFNQYWLREAGSSIFDYACLLRKYGYKLWNIGKTLVEFDGSADYGALANFNVLAVHRDSCERAFPESDVCGLQPQD